MKETAVDYLFQKLWNTPKDKLTWYKILIDAKVIEKDQMLEVSKEGIFSTYEFEQYYKETYEQK
jgi:uncharacterized protein (UPF0248 family)